VDSSIIIPSYNDGARLARCLDSLCAQDTSPGSWEVLVTLDGSTDGSRELLRRGCQGDAASGGPLDALVEPGAWSALPLRVVDLPENRGRSAARNAALAVAQGEWLCFLDADLRVGPNWLRELRACARARDVVSVGEMVYEAWPQRPLDPALLAAEPRAEALRRAALKRYQLYLETRGPWKHREQATMPARYFYTCNSCVHRSLLTAAGPFEERLRGWGGEDIDMGLKLGEAGAKLVYCKQARALHAQERSFARHCENLEELGREGLALLLERHPDLVRLLQVDRLLPARLGGRPLSLLVAARALGLQHLLVRLEAAGLPFPERLYDLTVYLHYAGAYREQRLRRSRGLSPTI
jgi:GT2 family glycosyltransferase